MAMESLNEFLKKIDFEQDTIFHTEDGILNTSMWDKNGQYVVNGVFKSPFPIEKFTILPKTLADAMSFATDISVVDGKLLKIQSIEVNGTLNLHEAVGREGAPKIEFTEENSFVIKADMISRILKAQKMLGSKLLTVKIENGSSVLRVKGDTEESGLDFKINAPMAATMEINLGEAVFGVFEKSSGFDLQVSVVNGKPVRFGLGSPAFSVFYYVMNQ